MSNKLISIILPSRGRIDLLKKFVTSIEDNTVNKSLVEVIFLIDDDDIETNNILNNFKSTISFDLNIIVLKKPENFTLNYYYSEGLKAASKPRFLWILNNDVFLTTKGWDLALQNISENEDKENLLYIYINDNTHSDSNGYDTVRGCCFPILSYNYYLATNEFFPKEVNTWGQDIILWEMVQKFNKIKILSLFKEISLIHVSPFSKDIENRRDRDECFNNMLKNNNAVSGTETYNRLHNQINAFFNLNS